jgi:2-polyprenyl-3-methyl-5-hydroxy-6-metoxy-1,4-benzoquinol methylase
MRFGFGRNWAAYAKDVGPQHLEEAGASLRAFLGPDHAVLRGARVLDVGCGSGLFSAAMALQGAREVVALDVDPHSVSTTTTLLARLAPGTTVTVQQGSILDAALLASLGQFDFIYAWGSLHHTGDMWAAVRNTLGLLAPGGMVWMALYNRTATTPAWTRVKQLYNLSPAPVQTAMTAGWFGARALVRATRGKDPVRVERGMHLWTDARDWLGGYPYEAATAEDVIARVRALGFTLVRDQRTTTLGCNGFLFSRSR